MMNMRHRLPNRRCAEIIEFQHQGIRYTVTASRFSGGTLGEIFVDGTKIGSHAQIAARDAGILASLALQNGITPVEILHALEKAPDGTPAGPVGIAIKMLGAMLLPLADAGGIV
jgi:hypothetical protein